MRCGGYSSGLAKVNFKDTANRPGGHGFHSWAGQINAMSPTAHHRCDAKARQRQGSRRCAPPLVTRFGVIRECNEDLVKYVTDLRIKLRCRNLLQV